MTIERKVALVTGVSRGIGAGIVKAFVELGLNVVANSVKVSQSVEVAASDCVALVDGDIGDAPTAARIAETAVSRFRSIDVLVNNAGIFFTKPFTDYTPEDFKSLISTNLGGGSCTSRSWPSSRCRPNGPAAASSRSRRLSRATRSGASRRRCR